MERMHPIRSQANPAPPFPGPAARPVSLRLPSLYVPLLLLAILISIVAALNGSFTIIVWATRVSAVIGAYLLLNDGLIMWRRGGIVGRLTVNFGVFYWFWLGAWISAGASASPPFPAPSKLYPGFLTGVPESVVATSLIGVNLFALAAMLGWRHVQQPRRLVRWLADRLDPQPTQWLDLLALGLVLLAWVPLFIAYQGDLASAFQDLLRMRGGGKIGPSQDSGLAHHLGLLGVFGAALSLTRIALRSPGLRWAHYLAVGLMAPIVFLGQSSRFYVSYLLLPAVIILMSQARHSFSWRQRRMTLIALVAIGALLLLYQGGIRNTGLGGERVPSASIGKTMETGFVGHDHFGAMLIAVDLVDKQGRFFMEPMAPLFITHFIPRSFWLEKPGSVSWEAYNAAWTQGHAFNVTPSITGQYYMNWGYPGILYIGLFIGWLARLCEMWFTRLDLQRQLMSATVAGLLLGFIFLSFRFFYPLYFAYPLFGYLAYRVLSRRMPSKPRQRSGKAAQMGWR